MKQEIEQSSNEIWIGFDHLFRPISDLVNTEKVSDRLDEQSLTDKERQFIEIIRNEAPDILYIKATNIEMDSGKFQRLMTCLGDQVEPGRRFIFLRRLLEIIAAGNRQGRFKIPIPYLPAPLPSASPSPFQHQRFQVMVQFQAVIKEFNKSLILSPNSLSPDEWWGRILFSSILYGGLIKPDWLLAIPEALNDPDPELRWLDLPVKNRASDNQSLIRRWFPDPLTRLLITEGNKRGIPEMPLLNRIQSRQVMKLIQTYARCADFADVIPRNFANLREAVFTRMHLYLPPFLVHYAKGQHDSTSLPDVAWQRLVNLPETVASHLLNLQTQNIPSRILSAVDADEDDEDWPEQLRALSVEVRKGEKGSQQRIEQWLKDNRKDLLPSVARLGEWVSRRLLRQGRGRRVLRIRTVYAMLNGVGSRLIGQLGNHDPSSLEDAEAYIELYSTALEDTPSVMVRRRVAHSLRSFHGFLVESYGAPSLEDSGIFAVYGKNKGSVDANIIGIDTFFRALQLLNQIARQRHNSVVAQALCRIAGLGFFAGLRRSEAIGLKINDLEGNNHVDLLVRPNGRRKLKTRSAQRVLPLSNLMPPEELRRLLRWRDERMKHYRYNPESGDDLFIIDISGQVIRDNDPLMELITEVLQRVTHDPHFRFHHLRHSFANWQLVKFWLAEQNTGRSPLPEWFLNADHELNRQAIAPEERRAILGQSPTNRRSLMQISRLLGHSTVDITLTHYIHLLDLLTGRALRRMTPEVRTGTLAIITGYSNSHVRRVRKETRQDGNQFDDQNAIELDRLTEKLLADGRHLTVALTSKKKVRFDQQPLLAPPTTALGRLQRVAEVLNAWSKEPKMINDIVRHYGIHESWIRELDQRARKLPAGIMKQSGQLVPETNSCFHYFDLPKGPKQIGMAVRVADKLEKLMSEGDNSGTQIRSIQKKLNETIAVFIEHWESGTPFTVILNSLPDAKKWCWLLDQLGLKQGIVVNLYPSYRIKARPEREQVVYWEDALGIKINGKVLTTEKEVSPSRGSVQIRVDLRLIPDEINGHKKVTVLTGVRFTLAMWWLTNV